MLVFKYKWLTLLFATLAVVYLVQGVLVTPDQEVLAKYHISSTQAIGLALTIAVPYLTIWFIALGGYLRFKDYTRAIAGSHDGAAWTTISRGILLLSLWLPVSAVLTSLVTNYYHHHPAATAGLVRLDNYANLLLLLPAFWLINRGAQQLLVLVKRPLYRLPQAVLLSFIAFAALYVFLTLQDPARQLPTSDVEVASYYLPDWAIVTTIIIPRLIMWFLGIQAIYYIYLYAQKIKGSLYRQALRNLARGLAWVVLMIIVLRCFQSLSAPLARLNLSLLLLLIYVLLALVSVGYVLIAKGARKLHRLEEV